MALSAGTRQAVGMATGWLVVACGGRRQPALFQRNPERGPRRLWRWSTRTRRRASIRCGPSAAVARGRTVEIRAGAHGHYFASVEINGRPIDVLVDFGASIVALSYDDAERAGVYVRDRDYTQRVSTANGHARVAPVVLDRISIGDITVRNIPAAVSEPGSLGTSLLGMSFLGRLQRVEMRSGTLVLQE